MLEQEIDSLVPSRERGDFDIVMNGLEATADRVDRIKKFFAQGFAYAFGD